VEAAHELPVVAQDVELEFLALTRPTPTSVIGAVFHDPGEVPGLLRELIDHHAHYRDTACAFAGRWRDFHNAGRLLGQLDARAGATP